MDYEAIFDGYLKKGDKERAFYWVMEKVSWNPDSVRLRGMSAFAMRIFDQRWLARSLAEELLAEEPNEEWALATLFSSVWRLEDSLIKYRFAGEWGFSLGHEWIDRFKWVKQEEDVRNVIFCLARYGSPNQKAVLSEKWLAGGNERYGDEEQMELFNREFLGG